VLKFILIYLVPPTLSRPPQNATFNTRRIAFLECGVDSETFPEPTVQWLKGSVQVNNNNRYFISPTTKSLIIRDVSQSDGGMYTCGVENVAGTIRHSATLTVVDGSM